MDKGYQIDLCLLFSVPTMEGLAQAGKVLSLSFASAMVDLVQAIVVASVSN